MELVKRLVPVMCLLSAYVHYVKPRLLSVTASKGGKSLLLHLCAQSRVLIPMIVITAFWIFDAHMQIEASVSLTITRNVRITLGPDATRPEDLVVDDDDDDDGDEEGEDNGDEEGEDNGDEDNDDEHNDDDETYSFDSYSDNSSMCSDNLCVMDDIQNALQDLADGSLSTEDCHSEHHHHCH